MNTKKLLALVLVLALVICTLPVVFADGGEPATPKDEDIGMNPSDVPADDEEEILYGDVNGDNAVDISDANDVLQHYAGWQIAINLEAADVNCDGAVDISDANDILQYYAGWQIILGPQ